MRILAPLLFCSFFAIAQSNTEVYLFNIIPEENTVTLTNQQNISNNDGYDNQPSFYNDNQVLFASTRNGQTDIASYSIKDGKVRWINDTGFGSEYSPTKIPNQKAVSSIRLDTTGLQRLYSYDFKTGKNKEIIKGLVIGYHTWYSKDILISSVLADGGLDLVVSNLKDGTNYTQQKKIGRSLHKIPNSNLISYISKENEKWEIKSLNPITGATQKIIETVPEAEDMCWLNNGTILMPKGNILYAFNPTTDTRWKILTSFQDPNLYNITRVATNPTSTLLAVVSDISPEVIIKKQLDAYNARDIEAFLATYSNNAQLFDFPDKKTNEGKQELRTIFDAFFKRTPDLHVEIKNRIIIGNKVIDEEYVTANGNNFNAVAIYEVQNGKITKVTFIR
ncbi:nuclear transport factor 2 family protein [uncultured Dokdonia sp.]|uniref:nuclear transport factor 2 family protein n=1 Tax=uncultured Dokdonia sp. TaxID=575653 RepID=UPI00261286F1|nr:nuclear transport factor 2 family protein [uncultured Dokdonia sp.]